MVRIQTPATTALGQRNRRLAQYSALVRPIALHYALRSPEPIDDLIQVGMLGLLRAAERYHAGSGTPFEQFARPHIRGAILHHLRDGAWLVRLPRRQAEQRHRQTRHGGSTGSPERMAALQRWHALCHPLCLEDLQAGEREIAELACDAHSDQSVDGSYPDAGQRSVSELLGALETRQRAVLQHVVLQGWSYRRTATALQVSAPTVQRLLHRGLAQLREQLSCRRYPAPSAAEGC
jgi:RNA polymerase sigma-B factor